LINGKKRPCRDAGVGEIAPGFAMLERAKRASHIDLPASPCAIMRRACPYRGENPEPGKDVHGEIDPWPGIREQPGSGAAVVRGVNDASTMATGDHELYVNVHRPPMS
jgi:hypothetical protein